MLLMKCMCGESSERVHSLKYFKDGLLRLCCIQRGFAFGGKINSKNSKPVPVLEFKIAEIPETTAVPPKKVKEPHPHEPDVLDWLEKSGLLKTDRWSGEWEGATALREHYLSYAAQHGRANLKASTFGTIMKSLCKSKRGNKGVVYLVAKRLT